MIDRAKRYALAAIFSAARQNAQQRAPHRRQSWERVQEAVRNCSIRFNALDMSALYELPVTHARHATMPLAENDEAAWQHAADAFHYACIMGTAGYSVMFDLAEPSPYKDDLSDLAREYYDRTEAYDRTVCTGAAPHGRILPANGREAGLINHNATQIYRELVERAERIGYSAAQLKRAMNNHIQQSRH